MVHGKGRRQHLSPAITDARDWLILECVTRLGYPPSGFGGSESPPHEDSDSATFWDGNHKSLQPPSFSNKQIRETLERALGGLSELERKIIGLYYVSELSIQEISSALGLEGSRVLWLKKKAVGRIREVVDSGQLIRREVPDNNRLLERAELLAKKYSAGLEQPEIIRLAKIDEFLNRQEMRRAELIDARRDERIDRIDAGLSRVEKAIRDLHPSSPR